jgi:VanZ family protein
LTPRQKQILKAWIPSLVWLTFIAIESTAWLSSNNTSRFLYPIFHFLTGVTRQRFAVWNFYIRKSGHFVGYFTLSSLLFFSWRATFLDLKNRRWTVRWAWDAWLMTVLVATLDEWHQTFIPSRTGTFHDSVLDSSAALIAQILICAFLRTREHDH